MFNRVFFEVIVFVGYEKGIFIEFGIVRFYFLYVNFYEFVKLREYRIDGRFVLGVFVFGY